MKAPDFEYHRPETLEAALALLADYDGNAQPLAGGQSLMPMMNFRVATPAALVDLAGIESLTGVVRSEKHMRIGAMTRYRDLEALPDLATALPLVAMALPHIAHDAIRNRGTLGGSLALADPAAEMPAVMRAVGAEIELTGPSGARSVAADDFFAGYYETVCGEDELITAITVPIAQLDQHFGFYELTQRHGDYALAGVCISAAKSLQSPRIVFFGVADGPVRVPALEQALNDSPADIDATLAHLDEIDFAEDLKATATTRKRFAGTVLKRAIAGMTL